jgi:hypothetical protein
VAVGSVTVSNTSVSIGSVAVTSAGVSLGGTSTINATTYTGTANNSIHLGGIHSSLYLLESAADAKYSAGGGGGGFAADTFDYGSIATQIDIELNRDYGTL